MQEAKNQLYNLIKHASDLDDKLDHITKDQQKKLQKHRRDYKDMLFKLLYDLNLNTERAQQMEHKKMEYKEIADETINTLLGTKDDIKDYDKIKTIAIVHRNLKKANDLSKKLKNLEEDVKNYMGKNNMSERSAFESFLECDIAEVHKKVYDFEEFKYELVYYAKEIDRESFLLVQRKINMIDKVTSEFIVDILKISINFLQIFEDKKIQESTELVIMREEQRDETTRLVHKQVPKNDLVMKELVNMNVKYIGRTENKYKDKFEEGMRYCIRERIKGLKGADVYALNNLYDEFTRVKGFKDKKDTILDWTSIIQTFHDELRNFFLENPLPPKDIVFVLDFTEKYYKFLESDLNIHAEVLGEDLLSGRENQLIGEYIKTATFSLSNWIDTITEKEVNRFHQRIATPMFDEDNKYISENFITFLSLIKQQLEPIAFSPKILSQITAEIVRFTHSFAKEIVRAMERDFTPACKQKDNPGYEEYVITIGNSGLKITEYISSVPQGQSNEIKELGNIFLTLAKRSNNFLTLFVINTCKPVLDKVFTDVWYNEDIINIFLITIEDFFSDYKLVMVDFLFYLFIDEIISEITKSYLKQLTRKRAKLYEDCGYRLDKDISRLTDLLKKYNDDASFDVLQKIVPLLGKCNLDIFIIELKSLLMAYPDIKRDYIKNIILKKDYLSDAERKTFLAKTKECFNELKSERKTLFSSIFF